MDVINSLLAGILDKFKAKNPKVFAFVIFILLAFQFLVTQAVDMDLLIPVKWVASAVEFIPTLLLILTGSRTVRFMPPDDVARLRTDAEYLD